MSTAKDDLRDVMDLLGKRSKLIVRLIKALQHLPLERQYAIVTSFIPIEQLEEIVKFQENR